MKYRIAWSKPNGEKGFIMGTYQWVAGALKWDTPEEAEGIANEWRKDEPTMTFTVEPIP